MGGGGEGRLAVIVILHANERGVVVGDVGVPLVEFFSKMSPLLMVNFVTNTVLWLQSLIVFLALMIVFVAPASAGTSPLADQRVLLGSRRCFQQLRHEARSYVWLFVLFLYLSIYVGDI